MESKWGRMKAKDVEPGLVFKYADCTNPLLQQAVFIRLIYGKVVNVANWVSAIVDDDTDVEVIGRLKFIPMTGNPGVSVNFDLC